LLRQKGITKGRAKEADASPAADISMSKAYVRRRQSYKELGREDFSFCSMPENAEFWATREDADTSRRMIDIQNVQIPSA
jgi:hypothetical protein